ncbi:MAG: SurA N-terminal domain-containing protein [Nitrospiraceae bacterium]|nr:SurA N-terminal domain-containing protein [Nitrospiraceae bacterium]
MKKIMLVFLMMALALISCNRQKTGTETSGSAPSASSQAYLAKVNDVVITKQMYDEELNALPEQLRQVFLRQGGPEAFLNELVNKELLYQEARKKGLDKDQRLAKAVEDYRKITMVKLLLQDQIENKTSVSDDDVKKFYDQNKQDFKVLSGKDKGKTVDFDMVKELIRQRLNSRRQEQAFNDYLNGLKKSNKVEINQQEVSKLK